MPKVIQSIIFDKKLYTPAEAIAWLYENDFIVDKIHTTQNYHRFRQFKPDNKNRKMKYYTANSTKYEGIKFIIFAED